MTLTGIVIAKNESKNITRCLKSLSFCTEILVVDNNSTDNTRSLAGSLGAKVISFSGKNDYSALRNAGLAKAGSEWVLFVDADEIVPEELNHEILSVIQNTDIRGFEIPRVDFLWDKKLKYGDLGGFKLLRLAQKNSGIWTGKVHEVWKITGKIGGLNHALIHFPHTSLESFLILINRYSDIRAQELCDQNISSDLFSICFYPVGKFLYLWLFKLGVLDGMPGLIHAMTMAFYSFLVRGKLYLLNR